MKSRALSRVKASISTRLAPVKKAALPLQCLYRYCPWRMNSAFRAFLFSGRWRVRAAIAPSRFVRTGGFVVGAIERPPPKTGATGRPA